MKKIMSVLLCAVLVLSAMVFSASAAEEELKIAVVNDLHLDLDDATAERVVKRNNLSVEYAHAASSGQLPYESVAIIRAFLRDMEKSDNSVIIMPGDLTTVGTAAEHKAFVALIKEFEEKTGKSVFVIPGNHDLFNSSVEEFEELYQDFGYSEAIANDSLTASYVADLGGDYRLLAIDSVTPGESVHGVDENLINWVKEQCAVAASDGKKLICMMHHNLTEHMPFVEIYYSTGVVCADSFELADALADGGVKFIFTGHTHDHDIAQYTSPAGNILYDCVTSALNAYPCAYREVSFGENVKISTGYVTEVDTELFPAGIHEAAMETARTNFPEYAKNSTYLGVEMLISSFISPSSLNNFIKLEDEEFKAILMPVIERAAEVFAFPLYIRDETEAGKSFESIVVRLGSSLPDTEYKTFTELLVVVYQAHAEGDERLPAYSDEIILVQRCLAAAINFSLAELTSEEYARVLTFVTELLDIEISAEVLNLAGGALEMFKGNEMLLAVAVTPVLSQFTVDEAPADINVSLPGYGKAAEAPTLLEKFVGFFRAVYEFFLTVFAFFVR